MRRLAFRLPAWGHPFGWRCHRAFGSVPPPSERRTYYHIGNDEEVHFLHRDASGGKTPLHPPLLLIHGAGCDSTIWHDSLRHIAGAHTVAIDLPGHGRSPGPSRKSIAQYAEIMATITENFLASTPQRFDGAILVGHCMGGSVAQAVAKQWPHLVIGMILINCGDTVGATNSMLQQLEAVENFPAGVDALSTSAFPVGVAGKPKDVYCQMLRQSGPAVAGGDLRAYCGHVPEEGLTIPTLILSGEHDQLVPRSSAERLAAKVSSSCTHHTVRCSGHVSPLDQPEGLRLLLHGWVRRQRW